MKIIIIDTTISTEEALKHIEENQPNPNNYTDEERYWEDYWLEHPKFMHHESIGER
jgi:hypothetical protein